MKTSLDNFTVRPSATILDAIAKISLSGKKVVFVTDDRCFLLGIFSDGDLRRHILSGGKIDDSVSVAMNKHPFVLHSEERSQWHSLIHCEKQASYPVVDQDGYLVDALFWDDAEALASSQPPGRLPPGVHTVIMAGGLGTRLYPYTKVLPKALIPIGDEPICTRVINSFKEFGCVDYTLILNHQKELVKAFYASGHPDVSIRFVDEDKPLGTAGGLALLKDKINGDMFVSNCDILLRQDYAAVYSFHIKNQNLITVIGAEKDVPMPYGVIRTKANSSQILTIDEKPKMSLLTNVGVYVINSRALDYINDGEKLLMTDLVQRCINDGKRVGVFAIPGECWLDMGQMEEMKHMVSSIERSLT